MGHVDGEDERDERKRVVGEKKGRDGERNGADGRTKQTPSLSPFFLFFSSFLL